MLVRQKLIGLILLRFGWLIMRCCIGIGMMMPILLLLLLLCNTWHWYCGHCYIIQFRFDCLNIHFIEKTTFVHLAQSYSILFTNNGYCTLFQFLFCEIKFGVSIRNVKTRWFNSTNKWNLMISTTFLCYEHKIRVLSGIYIRTIRTNRFKWTFTIASILKSKITLQKRN